MASASDIASLRNEIEALTSSLISLLSRVTALEGSKPSAKATPSPAAPKATGSTRAGKRPQPPARIAATTAAPLPSLAQTFPMEGKPSCYQMTCIVPDAVAGHVVGHQGCGLKQIADISGARVTAFVLKGGPADQRHVSIRGSDSQIGEALVILGKRLARQRVRTPRRKTQGRSDESGKTPATSKTPSTKPSAHLPGAVTGVSVPTSPATSSTPASTPGPTGPLHKSGFTAAAVSAYATSTTPTPSTSAVSTPLGLPSGEYDRARAAITRPARGRGRHGA
jgi:hypothetical protein